MKLGNAGEGISGDMSTFIAECSFWMMIHGQTGNLFALTMRAEALGAYLGRSNCLCLQGTLSKPCYE